MDIRMDYEYASRTDQCGESKLRSGAQYVPPEECNCGCSGESGLVGVVNKINSQLPFGITVGGAATFGAVYKLSPYEAKLRNAVIAAAVYYYAIYYSPAY